MRSIKTTLIITVAVSVFAVNSLSTLVSIPEVKKAMEQAARSEIDTLAQHTAQKIYDMNEKEIQSVQILASMPAMKSDETSLKVKCDIGNETAWNTGHYSYLSYYDIDGWFVLSERNGGYTVQQPNISDSMAYKTRKPYLDPPTLNQINGALTLYYTVPVFNENNVMNGFITALVPGEIAVESLNDIYFGKSNHPIVMQMGTGKHILDVNLDNIANGYSLYDDTPAGDKKDLLRRALNGENGFGEYKENGEEWFMSFQPVGGNCDWVVVGMCPRKDYFGAIDRANTITAAGSAVAAVIVCVIIGFMISSAINPLISVKTALHALAKGNADLTQRLHTKANNEIGGVVTGFNEFTAKMDTLVADIKETQGKLEEAGDKLGDFSVETQERLASTMHNMHDVESEAGTQSDSVQSTAGAVNEIAANIKSLERMIENQVAGVTQASAAVEEMIGNINSVTRSVEMMASSFADLLTTAQNGSLKQEHVNEQIRQIESQSEMLQEANQAIASIAEQTNLLAMNAAIEAAHAGDAGKGFSVVADEIRKLSETSSEQSRTIGEQLNNIQESIMNVVEASVESQEAFTSVSNKINDTDELVHQIKSAMEEQQAGSRQISDALHNMNDTTQEVRVASQEMSAGNQAILDEVRHLQNATDAIKVSINSAVDNVNSVTQSGEMLKQITERIGRCIEHLSGQVGQFTSSSVNG